MVCSENVQYFLLNITFMKIKKAERARKTSYENVIKYFLTNK